MNTIRSRVFDCLNLLEDMQSPYLPRSRTAEVPDFAWYDELERLRVWVVSTDALEGGPYSLDYRLHEVPHVKSQVIRQLDRLRRIVGDFELAVRDHCLGRHPAVKLMQEGSDLSTAIW